MEKVELSKYIGETEKLLRNGGLLLVAEGKDGVPNAMTIGWGLMGVMWSQPFFVVAVRKSRHTYKLIEESNKFTVCVPGKGMDEVLQVCGTKSGRDMDKFKELGLKAVRGKSVDAPYIEGCPIVYECDVAYKTQVEKGDVALKIEEAVYGGGNYHALYYGWVKAVYAEPDAASKLP